MRSTAVRSLSRRTVGETERLFSGHRDSQGGTRRILGGLSSVRILGGTNVAVGKGVAEATLLLLKGDRTGCFFSNFVPEVA